MYFKQISVEGLGCFSYCIGCPNARQMAVVDPKRDIQDYLDIARNEGMKITHIFETHIHADHVSGGQELKSVTGADIYLYEHSPAKYPFKPLKENDCITIGPAKIEILHTPGHTPHSISLLVTDTARCDEPEMLLSGDVLFVGDIGRPDLAGEENLKDQIRNLYTSLYEKLGKLPDYIEVFPAHGQGSLCGRGMSAKPSSTLGYERRSNPMLKFGSFEEFAKELGSVFPTRPRSFTHIIETNMRGANLLGACSLDAPLTPDQFAEKKEQGAIVIDVRDSAGFGGSHIPGSLNIGFEKQLANWVGMVVEPQKDILLVVTNKAEYDRMLTELHRIGYDNVLGYLNGGIMAWLLSGRPLAQLPQLSPLQFWEQKDKKPMQLIDVRTPAEWETGKLEGALHLPLNEVMAGKTPQQKAEPVLVYCGTGYRSNIAASYLQQHFPNRVCALAGGLAAWEAAELPLVS